MAIWNFEWISGLLGLNKEIDQYPGLELVADGVQARLEDHLGRIFETGDQIYTRTYFHPTAHIGLPALPISSVTTVTIGGVSTTDYTVHQWGLQLGSKVTGEISVEYVGGYSEAPEWLKRALTIQIIYEWQNKDNMGAESVTNEGGTIQRPALQLLSEVRRTLEQHVHPLAQMW